MKIFIQLYEFSRIYKEKKTPFLDISIRAWILSSLGTNWNYDYDFSSFLFMYYKMCVYILLRLPFWILKNLLSGNVSNNNNLYFIREWSFFFFFCTKKEFVIIWRDFTGLKVKMAYFKEVILTRCNNQCKSSWNIIWETFAHAESSSDQILLLLVFSFRFRINIKDTSWWYRYFAFFAPAFITNYQFTALQNFIPSISRNIFRNIMYFSHREFRFFLLYLHN